MPHSLVLRASAVVMMIFGLPLLLAPNAFLAMYKAPEMNGPGIYNTMLFGAMLIAVAVLNWLSSREAAPATRYVVIANLVGNVLGFLVTLYRQLVDPSVPPTAWVNVGVYLVFAVLFAQLWLRLRSEEAALAGAARVS